MTNFAIKIGKTTGDKLFADLIKKLANTYGNFKVENLTHNLRSDIKVGSDKLKLIGNDIVREIGVKQKKLEYLTIGFSNKFDVSFEEKSKLYFGFIPLIKVYDINKDFAKVVNLLGKYIADKFKLESLNNIINGFKTKYIRIEVEDSPTVVMHSAYAEVDGKPVAYKYKKKNKKKNKNNSLENLIAQLLNR